jgi:hypothetical protein
MKAAKNMRNFKKLLFATCIAFAWGGLPLSFFLYHECNTIIGFVCYGIFTLFMWCAELYESYKDYGEAFYLFKR